MLGGRRKPRLVFVARRSARKWGSQNMRVHQLARHMQCFHGDVYEVCINFISRRFWKIGSKAWVAMQPRDSIYFISKHVVRAWNSEDLDCLRRKAMAVLVDYVDLEVRHMRPSGVDAHIAASFAGARALQKKQERMRAAGQKVEGSIHTVLHNYDSAIDGLQFPPTPKLSAVFLGAMHNFVTTPQIAPEITVLDAYQRAAFKRNVGRLAQFNCHWCVRPDQGADPDRQVSPFTKGITATACNAVIITNHQVDDALELLGGDYPYMLDSIDAKTLNEGFRRLKETYGGTPWRSALERVMPLKEHTSHQSIAGQLHAVIRGVIR